MLFESVHSDWNSSDQLLETRHETAAVVGSTVVSINIVVPVHHQANLSLSSSTWDSWWWTIFVNMYCTRCKHFPAVDIRVFFIQGPLCAYSCTWSSSIWTLSLHSKDPSRGTSGYCCTNGLCHYLCKWVVNLGYCLILIVGHVGKWASHALRLWKRISAQLNVMV